MCIKDISLSNIQADFDTCYQVEFQLHTIIIMIIVVGHVTNCLQNAQDWHSWVLLYLMDDLYIQAYILQKQTN